MLDCSLISPPEITENHLDFILKVSTALEHPAGSADYVEAGSCPEKQYMCALQAFTCPVAPAHVYTREHSRPPFLVIVFYVYLLGEKYQDTLLLLSWGRVKARSLQEEWPTLVRTQHVRSS